MLIRFTHYSHCSSGPISISALYNRSSLLCGTRIAARASLHSSPNQFYSPLYSPMAFHQAHSVIFKQQSKPPACSSFFFSPRSCSPLVQRILVEMKSRHPSSSKVKENRLARPHLLEGRLMVPSPSHPMGRRRTSSMKLSSGKKTKSGGKCWRKGLKPRATG